MRRRVREDGPGGKAKGRALVRTRSFPPVLSRGRRKRLADGLVDHAEAVMDAAQGDVGILVVRIREEQLDPPDLTSDDALARNDDACDDADGREDRTPVTREGEMIDSDVGKRQGFAGVRVRPGVLEGESSTSSRPRRPGRSSER